MFFNVIKNNKKKIVFLEAYITLFTYIYLKKENMNDTIELCL